MAQEAMTGFSSPIEAFEGMLEPACAPAWSGRQVARRQAGNSSSRPARFPSENASRKGPVSPPARLRASRDAGAIAGRRPLGDDRLVGRLEGLGPYPKGGNQDEKRGISIDQDGGSAFRAVSGGLPREIPAFFQAIRHDVRSAGSIMVMSVAGEGPGSFDPGPSRIVLFHR